jgi:hypothetical protein
MGVSGKTLKVSSVVAVLCISIYIAAIAFGAVRTFVSIEERRNQAEKEFYDLADRASSAAVSQIFMSGDYQETIRDFLATSETLLGIIITGSGGEFAFERFPGNAIAWAGDSPRFKTRFPVEPFYLPLRIEGQRNVTIQAVHSYINYDYFLGILRTTLLAVLTALAIAFFTLLLELVTKNRTGVGASPVPAFETEPVGLGPIDTEPVEAANDFSYAEFTPGIPEDERQEKEPTGLYTPRSNIGWESYTRDRLASELHRCASFEQDLVFLVMELIEKTDNALYRQFTEEAVSFFSMRDLIFEKGEQGISIIIPSTDLEQGIGKSEGFRSRIKSKLQKYSKGRIELCIGLSSRSGRLVEVDRLMLEASTALEKARKEPASRVIAFKSDLEKYREFIKHQP